MISVILLYPAYFNLGKTLMSKIYICIGVGFQYYLRYVSCNSPRGFGISPRGPSSFPKLTISILPEKKNEKKVNGDSKLASLLRYSSSRSYVFTFGRDSM